jgi:Arc/MetJ-type ribon-helix-helix transcriptional regulator
VTTAPVPVNARHPGLDGSRGCGNTVSMTTEKIAVSLPKRIAERARAAVRQGRAASVSAYVAAALEQKVKLDDLSSLLDEMLEETGGPLTAGERRAADRALGIRSKSARKKKHR